MIQSCGACRDPYSIVLWILSNSIPLCSLHNCSTLYLFTLFGMAPKPQNPNPKGPALEARGLSEWRRRTWRSVMMKIQSVPYSYSPVICGRVLGFRV